MRVYEYAKQFGVQSKDLLRELSNAGFVFPSHMAVMPQEAIDVLDKIFNKTTSPQASPVDTKSAQSKNSTPQQPARTAAHPSKTATPPSLSSQPAPLSSAPVADSSITPAPAVSEKKAAGKKGQKDVADAAQQALTERYSRSRETVTSPSTVGSIAIKGPMIVAELAEMLKKQPSELIFVLLKKGIVRPVNAQLSMSEIELVASLFEVTVTVLEDSKKHVNRKVHTALDDKATRRLPVVVIMGHVDHGKTTLLDYLRKTNVAAREHGGITQHLGAYEVKVNNKSSLVFLDTPGHEAFSYMRNRGAQITDIVVILVAANDGVKQQTLEAISLAKAAGVPIVVAINKIDKISSDSELDTVRTQLSQQGLTPEEWGGDTTCVQISAKTGQGIDNLLDMLQLHAEMLDLRSNVDLPARAFILETKQVKGQGWVATVICKEGTLHKGDYFVCGGSTGRVKLLIDSHDKQRQSVGPSEPIQVVGFDTLSNISDWIEVVSQETYNQAKSEKGFQRSLLHSVVQGQQFGEETGSDRTLRLVLKADTQGSCHALVDALKKIAERESNRFIAIDIVSSDIGPITEGDVLRALDTDALLYGLHVKPERNALALAKEKNKEIKTHTIIYHLLEEIEEKLKEEKKTIVRLVESGTAKVLKCFNLKGGSVIAGALIVSGELKEGDKVICFRNKKEIGSGVVKTLQRDKKSMVRVLQDQDCGFVTDSFHDWQPGDRIVIYAHEREA